jgi:hypothetical protein
MNTIFAWIARIFTEYVMASVIAFLGKLWAIWEIRQREKAHAEVLGQIAKDLKAAREANDEKAVEQILDRLVRDYNS